MGPYVHRELTIKWAISAGFSQEDAEIIGRACNHLDAKKWAKPWFHFRLFGAGVFSKLAVRRAVRKTDLKLLAYGLHMVQDAIGHGWILPFMHGKEMDEWSKIAADKQESIRIATITLMKKYLA